MKQIPIADRKGLIVDYALVDDSDFGWLSKWRWGLLKVRGLRYARRYERTGYKTKRAILMHREILGLRKGELGDHKDHNGLNNQRENVRLATHSQNMANRPCQKNNSCGLKGIYYWQAAPGRAYWKMQIQGNGSKNKALYFKTKEEAAKAYDNAARRLHGEFAVTNFSLEAA